MTLIGAGVIMIVITILTMVIIHLTITRLTIILLITIIILGITIIVKIITITTVILTGIPLVGILLPMVVEEIVAVMRIIITKEVLPDLTGTIIIPMIPLLVLITRIPIVPMILRKITIITMTIVPVLIRGIVIMEEKIEVMEAFREQERIFKLTIDRKNEKKDNTNWILLSRKLTFCSKSYRWIAIFNGRA